jgi:hypothetical protein
MEACAAPNWEASAPKRAILLRISPKHLTKPAKYIVKDVQYICIEGNTLVFL